MYDLQCLLVETGLDCHVDEVLSRLGRSHEGLSSQPGRSLPWPLGLDVSGFHPLNLLRLSSVNHNKVIVEFRIPSIHAFANPQNIAV